VYDFPQVKPASSIGEEVPVAVTADPDVGVAVTV
jgi:hypothetical protein